MTSLATSVRVLSTWLAAIVLPLAAHAQASSGDQIDLTIPGPPIVRVSGEAQIGFAKSFVTGINASGMSISADAPAALITTRASAKSIADLSLTAPISGWQGEVLNFALVNVPTMPLGGGIHMESVADDLTTSGGALTLSNLVIDPARQVILADLTGANDLRPQSQVAVFDLGSAPVIDAGQMICTASPRALCDVKSSATLKDVRLTPEGFAAFSQGLGLLEAGQFAFSRAVSTVPEAHSSLTMVLGLAGLVAARRRAKRSAITAA